MKVKYVLRIFNDADTYYGNWEKRRVLVSRDNETVIEAVRDLMSAELSVFGKNVRLPLSVGETYIESTDPQRCFMEKYEILTCLEIDGSLFMLTPYDPIA